MRRMKNKNRMITIKNERVGTVNIVRVCAKASLAEDAFTQTRLIPAFRVSTGLHVGASPVDGGRCST